RELRTDPHTLRQKYADLAIENAVVDGVDRYDDDFRLEVTRTAPGQGAGAAVDSLHEDYTGWYQRTDENGQPVDFDFETGRWADGWTPEANGTAAEPGGTAAESGGPAAERQDGDHH